MDLAARLAESGASVQRDVRISHSVLPEDLFREDREGGEGDEGEGEEHHAHASAGGGVGGGGVGAGGGRAAATATAA
jgi:hypothetical protein